jgi:hypothetical protein
MAEKKLSAVYVSWPKPDFELTVKTNKHFRRNFYGAMQYAHYELSAVELKREVLKYLKALDAQHPFLARIKDMHENRFITVGKYMYLLNSGCDIPDDFFTSLMPTLEKVINEEEARIASIAKTSNEAQQEKDKNGGNTSQPIKTVISIQDRLREKAREAAGEVEGWIDEFMCNKKQSPKTVEDFINLFNTFELKSAHMRHMQDIFERRAEEIAAAASGEDKSLAEGYSNFSRMELKKFDIFHRNLLKACNMTMEVARVERAPRKKKPVSVDKLISKLKYKKEDKTLGIVSMSPSNILGSKEVWLYNTKTRKLAQYKAADNGGLSVKGASLLNFSADSAEKTLRKPAEALADFKKATKVKLRTFLKDLSTVDIPCNGKLNEHHIILRIDK